MFKLKVVLIATQQHGCQRDVVVFLISFSISTNHPFELKISLLNLSTRLTFDIIVHLAMDSDLTY